MDTSRHLGVDLHKNNFVVCYLGPRKPVFKKFDISDTGIRQALLQTLS